MYAHLLSTASGRSGTRRYSLRAVALVDAGTMATGRVHDWESKEWRHTKFYSLNTEWIGALARAVTKEGL